MILDLDETALRNDVRDFFCAEVNNVVDNGVVLDSLVGPYSCLVINFRSLLEVFALSFSNATLVYAFLLVLFFNIVNSLVKVNREVKLV